MSEEEVIVDPVTGGRKGQKIERYDLIPAGPMRMIARQFGIGARKYSDNNWRKGYRWSLSYGALQRHLHEFWAGTDIDAETGQPHLAAAAFHVLALLEFMETRPEHDDRAMRPGASRHDEPIPPTSVDPTDDNYPQWAGARLSARPESIEDYLKELIAQGMDSKEIHEKVWERFRKSV